MREQPGEHGFRERPLAGFRAVEECQRPERHHGHGQGGERKIAPARVEYQAERGLRGNERRHDQRDAQHVGHEKRRQALGRPQHFKKRRKPAPRHQGVGGQQRRGHCRRQQKTLNQPTAEPVAFVQHLVGAHAQQDPARWSRTWRPRATMPHVGGVGRRFSVNKATANTQMQSNSPPAICSFQNG